MSRWRRIFSSEAKRIELNEEIAAHLAMAEADYVKAGVDPVQARRRARREFGNQALVEDVTRNTWGWQKLESLLQDLRYTLRQLRKAPGFSCSVIGTLALGIAAATAMFTVLDRTMFAPSPYKQASRLVAMYQYAKPPAEPTGTPYQDVAQWRDQLKSFEAIAFYKDVDGRNFLAGNRSTSQIRFTKVSGNLFATLGVEPQLGPGLPQRRDTFASSEDDQEVVISDAAWHSFFDADPGIVGRSVQINDLSYTVVGVMPRGFYFPTPSLAPEVWAPTVLDDADRERRFPSSYSVIGRLRDGVSVFQAGSELQAVETHVYDSRTHEDWDTGVNRAGLDSFASTMLVSSTRHALIGLAAAAALLWLIACLNVTSLLLARSSVRAREIAMRGALGASRLRLIQQFIVEGVLMSGAASAIGSGLAIVAVKLFNHLLQQLPSAGLTPSALMPSTRITAGVSVHLLATLIVLTVVTSVVSSGWPAWLAARAPIEGALRRGGAQGGTARTHSRIRSGLVIAQIAMSLALLASCGLLLRTIHALSEVPLGFRTDHILVADMQIPTYRFVKMNAEQQVYAPLLARVQQTPGVDAAGLVTEVPLENSFNIHLQLDQDSGQGTSTVAALFKAVTPGVQRVFGFSVLAGRYFAQGDTGATQPVAVVNRAFARQFAPREKDLRKIVGMQIMALNPSHGSPKRNTTIIGILDDVHQLTLSQNGSPEVLVLPDQLSPESPFYKVLEGVAMDLVVRTTRSPDEMTSQLRTILKGASAELADARFSTMDEIVKDSYGDRALASKLLGVFAASALLLCIAGLYGLMAYIVSQRTREMGVRFALGAQQSDVMLLVLRQASVLVVSGIGIGLVLALCAGRLVQTFLYNTSPSDVWTLGSVTLALVISGFLSALFPARRASSISPVQALRTD